MYSRWKLCWTCNKKFIVMQTQKTATLRIDWLSDCYAWNATSFERVLVVAEILHGDNIRPDSKDFAISAKNKETKLQEMPCFNLWSSMSVSAYRTLWYVIIRLLRCVCHILSNSDGLVHTQHDSHGLWHELWDWGHTSYPETRTTNSEWAELFWVHSWVCSQNGLLVPSWLHCALWLLQ